MDSSCCMAECSLSQPTACPGISKGSCQACVTPMQKVKLAFEPCGLAPWMCITSKGKEMASFRLHGLARGLWSSDYLDHLREAGTEMQPESASLRRGFQQHKHHSEDPRQSECFPLQISVALGDFYTPTYYKVKIPWTFRLFREMISIWYSQYRFVCVVGADKGRQESNPVCTLCLVYHQDCLVVIIGSLAFPAGGASVELADFPPFVLS